LFFFANQPAAQAFEVASGRASTRAGSPKFFPGGTRTRDRPTLLSTSARTRGARSYFSRPARRRARVVFFGGTAREGGRAEAFFQAIDRAWPGARTEKIALRVLSSMALMAQTDYERGTNDGDILETASIAGPTKDLLLELAGRGRASPSGTASTST
jgi:hypothetical protein